MNQKEELLEVLAQYRKLGIAEQLNYDKFNLYSLITHSTAMEGSTLTEIQNQLLLEEGIPAKGKSRREQQMNIDLKSAYDVVWEERTQHTDWSVDRLKQLAALVMKNTGRIFEFANGQCDTRSGEFRTFNITAGVGGSTFLDHTLIASRLEEYCRRLNVRRHVLLDSDDLYNQYLLSFDAYFLLYSIHPWVEGNALLGRLLMNALQYEFRLIPSWVMKEDKADLLAAWMEARTGAIEVFHGYMLQEHLKNLRGEMIKYQSDNRLDPVLPCRILNNSEGEPQELVDENNYEPQSGPQDKSDEPQKRNSEPQNEPQRIRQGEPQWQSIEEEILDAIRCNRKVTREELARKTGASLSTIKRRLKHMCDRVEYIGSGYSGYWNLKE